MSSNTWTPAALLSEAGAAEGLCWRVVEAQHRVSTSKLTDTLEEQTLLESLIEAAKPKIPEECRHLHYLLFTPFRYGAPYPKGSRFRRAGLTLGVFYGSEAPRTAVVEVAFHRLLFFAESPTIPWPTAVAQFTAFRIEYATGRAIDLSRPPFNAQRRTWRHLTGYAACQALAENARSAAIDVVKYETARDPEGGKNIAILSCRAFKTAEPTSHQTWRIHLSASGIRLFREFPPLAFDLDRKAFDADPRIADMRWERS
jgi:RES domain